MASGSARRIGSATASFANASGSTLFLQRFPPLFVRRPVQHALLYDVEKSTQHQHNEEQHFYKSEEFKLPVNYRPGIQKDRFDIEQDEYHPDQVKLYREPFARVANRLHARFIRRKLNRIAHAPANQS